MGNIEQFKIYWAIFLSVYFHQKTEASQRGIVTFELEANILVFFLYLTNIYIPWIKDFIIIAVTPNSWLVSSEHFHLHIEWFLYLLSCKCLAITTVIEVFSLSYYSWLHSIRLYALRNLDVDKYVFISFIRKL
jgi:hypothetical protein